MRSDFKNEERCSFHIRLHSVLGSINMSSMEGIPKIAKYSGKTFYVTFVGSSHSLFMVRIYGVTQITWARRAAL